MENLWKDLFCVRACVEYESLMCVYASSGLRLSAVSYRFDVVYTDNLTGQEK